MASAWSIVLLFCIMSFTMALDFVVIGDYGYISNLTAAEKTF